jgi:hypothetical protein
LAEQGGTDGHFRNALFFDLILGRGQCPSGALDIIGKLHGDLPFLSVAYCG